MSTSSSTSTQLSEKTTNDTNYEAMAISCIIFSVILILIIYLIFKYRIYTDTSMILLVGFLSLFVFIPNIVMALVGFLYSNKTYDPELYSISQWDDIQKYKYANLSNIIICGIYGSILLILVARSFFNL